MCIYELRIYELGFTNYEFTSCELPRPLPPPRKRGGGVRLRTQIGRCMVKQFVPN